MSLNGSDIMVEFDDSDRPLMTRPVQVPAGGGKRMLKGRVRIGEAERVAIQRAMTVAKPKNGKLGGNRSDDALVFLPSELDAIRAERQAADREFVLAHENDGERRAREQEEGWKSWSDEQHAAQAAAKQQQAAEAAAQRMADLEQARALRALAEEDGLIEWSKATQLEAAKPVGKL